VIFGKNSVQFSASVCLMLHRIVSASILMHRQYAQVQIENHAMHSGLDNGAINSPLKPHINLLKLFVLRKLEN